MMSFLFPKQNIFFDLLKNVGKDLREISELFYNFIKEFKNFKGYAQKAKEIERHADGNTHAIIDKLNKTFITPFDREDIYNLAHELDDIVDLIENVIQNILLYKVIVKIPAFDKFAHIIRKASIHLGKMIDQLQQQKHSDELIATKIRIHELEDRGDDVFRESISTLFENEKDPMSVLKYKDILESLEKITDEFQIVSDIIEGIVVKST